MGYADIIYIYEDGINRRYETGKEQEKLNQEVGKAVLSVIKQSKFRRYPHAPVFGSGNCVNFIDDVHSTDEKLYLWSGNTLRPIQELKEDYFKDVERLVAAERRRRSDL